MGLVLGPCLRAALAWGAAGRPRQGLRRERASRFSTSRAATDEFLGDLTVLPGGKILAVGSRGARERLPGGAPQPRRQPRHRGFDVDGILRAADRPAAALQPRALATASTSTRRGGSSPPVCASGPGMGFNAFGFARYLPSGLPDPELRRRRHPDRRAAPFGDAFAVAAGPRDKIVAAGGVGVDDAAVVASSPQGGQPDTTLGSRAGSSSSTSRTAPSRRPRPSRCSPTARSWSAAARKPAGSSRSSTRSAPPTRVSDPAALPSGTWARTSTRAVSSSTSPPAAAASSPSARRMPQGTMPSSSRSASWPMATSIRASGRAASSASTRRPTATSPSRSRCSPTAGS